MRGRNQSPEPGKVPRTKDVGALADSIILGQHMPGSLPSDRIETSPVLVQFLQDQIAELGDFFSPSLLSKIGHDRLALGTAAVVHPVGQPARGLGVTDNDRRPWVTKRQTRILEGPAVEE